MFKFFILVVTKEVNKKRRNFKFHGQKKKELPYPILANKKSVAKMYLKKKQLDNF